MAFGNGPISAGMAGIGSPWNSRLWVGVVRLSSVLPRKMNLFESIQETRKKVSLRNKLNVIELENPEELWLYLF